MSPADCTVHDCGGAVYCRGLCQAHYTRWLRHGDPLAGGTTPGATARFLREVVMAYCGDDCLVWPYGRNPAGYATMVMYGRRGLAHRFACEQAYGAPPTPQHQAAHSCGNGHLGCVNPKHLRWASPSENQQDKVLHGTSNRGERAGAAVLTEADVLEIRSHARPVPRAALARRFGITKQAIHAILTRKTWGWLDDDRTAATGRLTAD